MLDAIGELEALRDNLAEDKNKGRPSDRCAPSGYRL